MKAWTFMVGCVGLIVAALPATAQETRKWSDIDCAQSKIVAGAGLKCRSTQVYSGSDSRIAGAGAGGQFQRWISYGPGADGGRVFFYALEAVDARSFTRPGATLEDVVRGFNSDYKTSSGFTPLAHLKGGDYQRFTNPKGEACVAIRKLGDSRTGGYRWLVVAGKCLPSGTSLTEADVETFLETTQFRG